MAEPKTSRPFQERFLNGYDRSQLRQDVQKVPAKSRFHSLKKKYATWALGATLAVGGAGIPKMIHDAGGMENRQQTPTPEQPADSNDTRGAIARDLTAAKQIADSVTTGVTSAASEVGKTVTAPVAAVADAAQAAPAAVAGATETVKQQFFQKEVPFGSIIYNEAKKNDLPPELVAAVVHTESKFVPTARSNRGAMGLMQLVPKTGRWMGARNLMNPAENIQAGAKYLKYLSDRFGGDQQKAVAAYNAGEGNVRRFNGVPPFKETQSYVSKVQNFQNDLSDRVAGQIAEAQ